MATKRLINEKQREALKKEAVDLKALKVKKAEELTDADYKKLVVIMARRAGLLK
jgi:hypothetical protein